MLSISIKTGEDFILIDTGVPGKRAAVEKELESSGCQPGNLKFIILTHGDYDHAGNAAHICEKYGTKIAMHADDSGMVEREDWNWNRKAKPDKHILFLRIVSFFFKPDKFDTFKPDLYVEDGHNLSQYGLYARVLHLPGYSKGSIGILTDAGDLFCVIGNKNGN